MAPIRSWISRLYSREGFRGPVVTLLSGTAVTLVLSYLAVPILTRLFTPEQFGTSDYFVMMVSVVITFASLRYEDAMMLPEDDDRAAALFWLALALTIVTTVIVAIGTTWSSEIAGALRVEAVAPWIWLLAPTVLLIRFGKLVELWMTRRKSFRTITGGEVTNKIAMLSARLGAGFATGLGAGGLIGGYATGQIASCLYYAAALFRSMGSPLQRRPTAKALRSVASRYWRFPSFSMPSSLLNAIVARLPVLLLPVFFGLDVVGLFGRAFVALAVPLSLIGTAVSQVFFVHAAEAHRDGRLPTMTETVHSRLVMIGLFPTLVVIAAGPQLFEFVFGAEWRAAGTYEQYLACWFFLGGVASPLTRIFDVLERQRAELCVSIAASLVLTLALILGGRTGSVLITMAAIGAAGTGLRLLQLGIVLHFAGVPFRRAVKPYLVHLFVGLPLVLPVWAVHDLWPAWATALTGAAAGFLYLVFAVRRELLIGLDA